nr:hypothetical protein [Mediterraneibacter faecis]
MKKNLNIRRLMKISVFVVINVLRFVQLKQYQDNSIGETIAIFGSENSLLPSEKFSRRVNKNTDV